MTMRKLVVQITDRINADDPLLDIRCFKRGDVLEILPADHQFTKKDLAIPSIRIIEADLDDEQAAFLLSAEPGTAKDAHKPKIRAVKLNLDALPDDVKVHIDDTKKSRKTVAIDGISNITIQKNPLFVLKPDRSKK
jgi:hypothetical protein